MSQLSLLQSFAKVQNNYELGRCDSGNYFSLRYRFQVSRIEY